MDRTPTLRSTTRAHRFIVQCAILLTAAYAHHTPCVQSSTITCTHTRIYQFFRTVTFEEAHRAYKIIRSVIVSQLLLFRSVN